MKFQHSSSLYGGLYLYYGRYGSSCHFLCMFFRWVSLALKCPSASSGVTRNNLIDRMGIEPVGKISIALAAISSIGILTWTVVLNLELHTLGLMPPLFLSKAALRFVAILKSPLLGKLCGSIAVATLFSGMAVTILTAAINLICYVYSAIGATQASDDSTEIFVA